MLKWCFVFMLGIMTCMAGVEFIENPVNNIFVGIIVLYSGVWIFAVAGIKLLQRSDW